MDLWPWMAVAGLGALHGLNPASGWMFAAACGVRARDPAQARRALLPMGIGHAASVAVVAVAVAQGLAVSRPQLQVFAGLLLLGLAARRWRCGGAPAMPLNTKASRAGIVIWSFLMSAAHGAGMMLVPALAPLCLADNPARALTASGSWVLALAAVGVHTAALLLTGGLLATGVCRGLALRPPRLSSAAAQRAWAVALALTGMFLLAPA